MTKPKRIQRKRTRGWKSPEGVKYVGRPGPFGNPFSAKAYGAECAVHMFRLWLTGDSCGNSQRYRLELLRRLPELRGRDLSCWCREDSPHCHADVLLALANKEAE